MFIYATQPWSQFSCKTKKIKTYKENVFIMLVGSIGSNDKGRLLGVQCNFCNLVNCAESMGTKIIKPSIFKNLSM